MTKAMDKPFIPRCPKCTLIPSLSLININDEHYIEYECENQHKEKLSFDKFIKECSKFNFDNISCLNCKNKRSSENLNLNYFYCFQCKNYLCSKCVNIHDEKLKEKHTQFVSIEKFDGICTNHCNSFSRYCSNHKRNICQFCENEEKHKDCKLLKIELFSEKETNELKNDIDKAIKIKNEVEDFQKQINESFDKIKKDMDEIIFLKNLIFTSEAQHKYYICNYNIASNLKAIKSISKVNNKKFELLSKYSNKLISLLKYGNFKTIKKHIDYINHMRILPDGRLSSCSNDGTINIYNKENYKLEHKIDIGNGVLYFDILPNNNIIACCEDGNMKIYELKNENSKLINELKSHVDAVLKVIIIENKLISCSRDNTMIVWEKKEQNYINVKSIKISDDNDNTNILQINENKLVSSSLEYIKFFDIKNNLDEIKTIESIYSNSFCNSMAIFNENILIICGSDNNGIYLIDINNYQLISNLLNDIIISYSIIKLSNGNILIGCYNYNYNDYFLIEYKYDDNDLIEIKSNLTDNSDNISGLIEMNNEVIISCSYDCSIKFWTI